MERPNKKALVWALVIGLTLAFIFGNSVLSREDSQDLSRGLLEDIVQALSGLGIKLDGEDDHWLRKLAHFCEFALLGMELYCFTSAMGSREAQSYVNCASFALAAAVTDESLQLLSARGSQVQDVLLDLSGALTGLAVAIFLGALIRRRRERART